MSGYRVNTVQRYRGLEIHIPQHHCTVCIFSEPHKCPNLPPPQTTYSTPHLPIPEDQVGSSPWCLHGYMSLLSAPQAPYQWNVDCSATFMYSFSTVPACLNWNAPASSAPTRERSSTQTHIPEEPVVITPLTELTTIQIAFPTVTGGDTDATLQHCLERLRACPHTTDAGRWACPAPPPQVRGYHLMVAVLSQNDATVQDILGRREQAQGLRSVLEHQDCSCCVSCMSCVALR